MNRNEEFIKLQQELEDTPLKLDYTLARARAKRDARRKKARKRAILAPIGSFAAVFAAFVLLVNVSPGFAYAAGQIPLIKELAKSVAASPSLSAAVENEYVQPIELEQTENGITARIEYAIVDQKQLNLFFTLESEEYDVLEVDPKFNNNLRAAYGCDGSGDDSGGIRKLTADFMDADVPGELDLTLRVYQRPPLGEGSVGVNVDSDLLVKEEYPEPNYIAELHFSVSLDPYYTEQGESIAVKKTIKIDDQTLILENAEIYPTHMRFVFDHDPANTAWLKSLTFYVENEKGERFEGISNGISASGDVDTPMMKTYMLESAFFAESKHLTMYITGARWLDKDGERILVDLENETAVKLPADIRLEQAVKKQNGWIVTFSAPIEQENHSYSIFGWSYYGLDGTEYELDGMSSSHGGYSARDDVRYVELPGRFSEEFELYDYTDSKVYLCPEFSYNTELNAPIAVKIK